MKWHLRVDVPVWRRIGLGQPCHSLKREGTQEEPLLRVGDVVGVCNRARREGIVGFPDTFGGFIFSFHAPLAWIGTAWALWE